LFAIVALLFAIRTAAAQNSEDWFWDKPIAGFQWEGLRFANRNELESMLKGYIGQPFSDSVWNELYAKLFALDWFEEIEPIALPAAGSTEKVVVKFIVKEKPSIASIRIVGNSSVRTSELLEKAGSKSGSIFSEDKIKADAVAMQRLYLEKGYPDAKVEYAIIPDPQDAGRVTVQFSIVEGNAVVVRKVLFSGNSALTSQSLKAQVTLKEAGLFQKGAFQESMIPESKKAIEDYYASRGYVDARVIDVLRSYSKDEKADKNYLDITFVVSEGKQWLFGGVQFEGNGIFSTEKLASMISLKKGEPLNLKKMLSDKQKIDDLYYESGYIFNSISMRETRDADSSSISYLISIVERDRAHIENISIKGNTKTKDYVIKREIPLEEGEVFSKTKIIDGLRNLYNLQYFSAIDPEIHQGSAENLMDLVINVEETSTAEIQFGVTLTGIGSKSTFPISGFVKWNDRNVGGTGRNLQINMTLSPDEQSVETSFGQNWFGNQRISQSLSFTVKHAITQTAQDSIAPIFTSQDIPDPFVALGSGTNEWNGLISSVPDAYLMNYDNYELSLGYSLGRIFKIPRGDVGVSGGLSAGLGMYSYDDAKYRPYEKEMRDFNGQWIIKNSIFARGYLNRLDYWYNPKSGFFLSNRIALTGLLSMERQFYAREDLKAEAYATLFTLPLNETWKFTPVVGIHTGVQYLFGHPYMPFSVTKDWVYLDGTFTSRGWKSLYGSKGTLVWENWLELRLPVVDQALWLDGFIDAGAMQTQNGWIDMTKDTPAADGSWNLAWKNIAFSVGFGARFVIPQFPFRLYFAKRFVFDGTAVTFKTAPGSFDFVLSITQPLY